MWGDSVFIRVANSGNRMATGETATGSASHLQEYRSSSGVPTLSGNRTIAAIQRVPFVEQTVDESSGGLLPKPLYEEVLETKELRSDPYI
jgi:hypothetical protein